MLSTSFDKLGRSISFPIVSPNLDVTFEFCLVVASWVSFISSERSVLAMDINSVNKVSFVAVTIDAVVTSTSNVGLEESFESLTVVESVLDTV